MLQRLLESLGPYPAEPKALQEQPSLPGGLQGTGRQGRDQP